MTKRSGADSALRTYYGIVMRLNSLANLGARASVGPLPLVWLFLWLLRPSEAVGRKVVAEVSEDMGVYLPVPLDGDLYAPARNARMELTRLATSLRLMAELLQYLIALTSEAKISFRNLAADPCIGPAARCFAGEIFATSQSPASTQARAPPCCYPENIRPRGQTIFPRDDVRLTTWLQRAAIHRSAPCFIISPPA